MMPNPTLRCAEFPIPDDVRADPAFTWTVLHLARDRLRRPYSENIDLVLG
jgi:hypothetical protein